jgi:hypothetical protein
MTTIIECRPPHCPAQLLLSQDPRGSSMAVQPARVEEAEVGAIEAAFLKAYRWKYIHSGAQHPAIW